MDLATLIGLIGAFGIVLTSIILGGSATTFVNTPSLLVVLGGTVMVVMMKFSIGKFAGAAKIAVKAFLHKPVKPESLIENAVELAKTARQGGLLALEDAEVVDDFMKSGLGLLIDGHPADTVKVMLQKDLNQTVQRHQDGQQIFKAIGDVGPAMGMIGTLIGLVAMLASMDDPSSIGPAMAMALLTTLYGAIFAFMILTPIAEKLERYTSEETANMVVVIEGIDSIVKGYNAMIIKDKLEARLPPGERKTGDEAAAA